MVKKMFFQKDFDNMTIEIISEAQFFPRDGKNSYIYVNKKNIVEYVKENYILNESEDARNVMRIKTALIFNPFKNVLNVLFKAIRDLEVNASDVISANNITDRIFNQFRYIWGLHTNIFSAHLEISLWDELLNEIDNWEKLNNFEIKKGIPYYFISVNLLQIGNFNFAYNYAHKAIEDDKYHGKKEDPNYDYHNSLAYSFATLNIGRGNVFDVDNYLEGLIKGLKGLIKEYNFKFNEKCDCLIIKTKFLSQSNKYEPEIYYFVYLLAMLTCESENINRLKTLDCDLIKIKALNYIFSFCLLLDKLMSKNTNCKYYSANVEILIKELMKSSGISCRNYTKKVKKKIKWKYNKPTNTIDSIKFMLKRNKKLFSNSPYSPDYTRQLNKKIINSMLIYFLRNRGAHDLRLELLDTNLFNEIKKALFYELFIIIQDFL